MKVVLEVQDSQEEDPLFKVSFESDNESIVSLDLEGRTLKFNLDDFLRLINFFGT